MQNELVVVEQRKPTTRTNNQVSMMVDYEGDRTETGDYLLQTEYHQEWNFIKIITVLSSGFSWEKLVDFKSVPWLSILT